MFASISNEYFRMVVLDTYPIAIAILLREKYAVLADTYLFFRIELYCHISSYAFCHYRNGWKKTRNLLAVLFLNPLVQFLFVLVGVLVYLALLKESVLNGSVFSHKLLEFGIDCQFYLVCIFLPNLVQLAVLVLVTE